MGDLIAQMSSTARERYMDDASFSSKTHSSKAHGLSETQDIVEASTGPKKYRIPPPKAPSMVEQLYASNAITTASAQALAAGAFAAQTAGQTVPSMQPSHVPVDARDAELLKAQAQATHNAAMQMAGTIGIQAILFRVAQCVMVQKNGDFSHAQQELADLNIKMDQNHKELLEASRLKAQEEGSSKNWGVAIKVFSWIGTLLMIIAGGTLIASGAGAVAGAMLMAGGILSLGSQIMEVSGGWRKVLDRLPGKNPEEKAAVLGWIQIAILVLCAILSISGVLFAGTQAFQTSSQMASALMGATALGAEGICSIGKGKADKGYYDALSEIKKHEALKDELRDQSKDVLSKMDEANKIIARGYDLLKYLLNLQAQSNAAFRKGLSTRRV